MNIKFRAKSVTYTEALGGDIVQFSFEENPDDDPLNPSSRNVSASISYEFPPCELSFEWCDGAEYGGGLKIKKYILTESIFHIYLEDDSEIEVSHSASAPTFKRIDALLLKELGSRRNA